MIRLEITEDQAETLREVLDHVLSELRMEIADTDRKAFRDHLKTHKGHLLGVVEALDAAE